MSGCGSTYRLTTCNPTILGTIYKKGKCPPRGFGSSVKSGIVIGSLASSQQEYMVHQYGPISKLQPNWCFMTSGNILLLPTSYLLVIGVQGCVTKKIGFSIPEHGQVYGKLLRYTKTIFCQTFLNSSTLLFFSQGPL